LKASVAKRTLDNITVVMIAFENFKRLAFPSSMPDNKGPETARENRIGSALDVNDNPLHYKTINSSTKNQDSENEENKGTLKGRRSEEPPDIYHNQQKLIETSHNRKDNISPESVLTNASPKIMNKIAKIIPNNQNKESNKPVQNIMKVGNLFMFNVYKNGDGSSGSTFHCHKPSATSRPTPVANIELEQFETSPMGREIPTEGNTCLDK
jgi:hypothetical protein